jgi:hypothetical protein
MNNPKYWLIPLFLCKTEDRSRYGFACTNAKREKCTIIEQDMFMPLWFVLSTTILSKLNAMECANVFYESGLSTHGFLKSMSSRVKRGMTCK